MQIRVLFIYTSLFLLEACAVPDVVSTPAPVESEAPEEAAHTARSPAAVPSPEAFRDGAQGLLAGESSAPGQPEPGFRLAASTSWSWLLPVGWPPVDDTVQLFLYETQALPTGRILYEHRGPLKRVEMNCAGELQRVESVEEPVELGRSGQGHRLFSEQQEAERALLAVICGGESREERRATLAGYCALMYHGDGIGDDLQRRLPAFDAWLACQQAGSRGVE